MQPNLSVTDLKKLSVPCPTIEIQNQLVEKIKKEQELVNANKQLIELLEQKIKDRIGKVWGTSAALTTSSSATLGASESKREKEMDLAAEAEEN